MDIVVWLRSLGLGKYEAAFRENEIDETVLPSLTHETLKELGVTAVGHRLKLLDAIAALRSDASGKAPSVDAASTSGAPSARPEDRAERRHVTVMFSDLVGSTALSARMDPEDLREVISSYQKCVADTVQRCGGFAAKFLGDGVLVYFGYPMAHEDDAERAVRAGLELVAAVGGLKTHAPLQTRVGTYLFKHALVQDAAYGTLLRNRRQELHARIGQTELYDPERDRQLALSHGGYDPTMACRVFGAHALWYLGYPDRGLQQCEDAMIFARALDHPPTLAFVSQIALHHYLRGEAAPAEAHAQYALDLALQHDFKFWLGHATISHGWAISSLGRAEGIDEIRGGIDAYRATGAELEGPLWAAMLADALLRHGRIEEALAVVDDALTKLSGTGVRLHLGELHQLQGVALVRSGAPPHEAQEAFRRAVDVAQGQGAKSLELRASMSMARLWRDQGKRDEARNLLAPVYGWFTEGFDTRDLKDAKALLDELTS